MKTTSGTALFRQARDTLIETRVAGEPFLVRVSGRAAAQVGETVHLAWDAADAQWFDLSSERRID